MIESNRRRRRSADFSRRDPLPYPDSPTKVSAPKASHPIRILLK